MTIKETYNYLLQVRILESKIQNCILQHDTLRSCLLPAGIRYDTDRVISSLSDQMSEITTKVIDLEHQILRLKHEKQMVIVTVTKSIYRLTSDNEKTVLLSYYIGRKTVEQIAEEMETSVRNVYYLKRKAISHISSII